MRKIFSVFIFLFSLTFAWPSYGGFFDKKPTFLAPNEAFPLSLSQKDDKLTLHWKIAPGYWLYQDQLVIRAKHATLAPFSLPKGIVHQDPALGERLVYEKALTLTIPVQEISANAELNVVYQGCTEGLCYPPEQKNFALNRFSPQVANAQTFASQLFHSKYAVFGFFLLGLGMAFTPCVLPMLPLLSALVIGTQNRPSNARAFALTFIYVQGMALTYTLLGLAVAAIGLPFQLALQSPFVLITLAVIFVLLALSMFGLFDLQLPLSWQNKLSQLSQKQQRGAFGGVFVMGALAGLVASPCTSAPLSGALLYVAQSGDLTTGAITLYLLALGMGLPLMLMTIFGNRILPKSGHWLNAVKTAFGFVMLALPIFLLSRLLPQVWENRLWSLLGMSFFLWLSWQLPQTNWRQIFKLFAVILAILCAQPLQNWFWQTENLPKVASQNFGAKTSWQNIHQLQTLQDKLVHNEKSLTIVDFYADWCVACKELAHKTFANTKVQQALENVQLIKVDVTENSPSQKALLKHFQILGLPAVLFFNQAGEEIKSARLAGFVNAEDFLAHLEHLPKQ